MLNQGQGAKEINLQFSNDLMLRPTCLIERLTIQVQENPQRGNVSLWLKSGIVNSAITLFPGVIDVLGFVGDDDFDGFNEFGFQHRLETAIKRLDVAKRQNGSLIVRMVIDNREPGGGGGGGEVGVEAEPQGKRDDAQEQASDNQHKPTGDRPV